MFTQCAQRDKDTGGGGVEYAQVRKGCVSTCVEEAQPHVRAWWYYTEASVTLERAPQEALCVVDRVLAD